MLCIPQMSELMIVSEKVDRFWAGKYGGWFV
jgi:hypothetical protein